jgi:hypothetical protein
MRQGIERPVRRAFLTAGQALRYLVLRGVGRSSHIVKRIQQFYYEESKKFVGKYPLPSQ